MTTESRNLAIKRREIEPQLQEAKGSNEDALMCFISAQNGGLHA